MPMDTPSHPAIAAESTLSHPVYKAFLDTHQLPSRYLDDALKWFAPHLDACMTHTNSASPRFIGINGCQGSGKSTLAAFAKLYLEFTYAIRVLVISIDDFYLSKTDRDTLSHALHPLLATRGVPGTHDLHHGLNVFSALKQGQPVVIPRFDKAQDDVHPQSYWTVVDRPVDIVLFEGWCVGVSAQAPEALSAPVNALEKDEDPQGIWRHYVNDTLGSYAEWFAYLDALWLLKAPDFSCVLQWRSEQEDKLARHVDSEPGHHHCIMDHEQLARFVQFYQRLTEHGWDTLPQSADVCWTLDTKRIIQKVDTHY